MAPRDIETGRDRADGRAERIRCGEGQPPVWPQRGQRVVPADGIDLLRRERRELRTSGEGRIVGDAHKAVRLVPHAGQVVPARAVAHERELASVRRYLRLESAQDDVRGAPQRPIREAKRVDVEDAGAVAGEEQPSSVGRPRWIAIEGAAVRHVDGLAAGPRHDADVPRPFPVVKEGDCVARRVEAR